MNLYGYALDNPVYYFDSLGLAYKTIEAAGMAGACAINCQSIRENIEYSGAICRVPGGYDYGPPLPGTSGRSPGLTETPCPPGGTKKVGGYHTHAAYDLTLEDEYDPDIDRNLSFSYSGLLPSDIKNVDDMGKPNIMADPYCNVHVYYPHTYDPKAPPEIRIKQRSGKSLGKCHCECGLCETGG